MMRRMAVAKWLSYLFHGPAWITFLAMGMATGGVAVCTFDLFELFRANFDLWASYGAMAIFEASPLQLARTDRLGLSGRRLLSRVQGLHGRIAGARAAAPTSGREKSL